jgi:cytochrome b involved in lipid metabolism
MKLYGLLLLVFIVGLLAGCSQPVPGGTVTTTNNQNSQDYTPGTMMNNQSGMMNGSGEMMQDTGISASQLAQHNSTSNCWVAYNGKVYDITKFLPIHPGGTSRIIPYCGTSSEFEQAFTRQHGTSQVGRLMQQGQYMGDLQ